MEEKKENIETALLSIYRFNDRRPAL